MDPLHRLAMRLRRDMAIQRDEEELWCRDLEVAAHIMAHPDFTVSIDAEVQRICESARTA